MSRAHHVTAALLAPTLILLAASCDKVWGISPRTLDPRLVCDDNGCRCSASFGDCDGDQANGCEVDFSQSLEACGTCGARCDNGLCTSGVCQCKPGFGDCDGDKSNGCEVDFSRSPEACGTCGVRCDNGVCTDAICQCKAGFTNCDSDKSNGCETSIADDPSSCGACGHDCLGSSCTDGRCAPTMLAKLYAPTSLAVDGGYLYIGSCDAPTLQRVPIRGGTIETVYEGQGCVRALAVDQGSLYFATTDQILTMKLDGSSPPSLVVAAPGFSEVLGVVGGYVYWQADSSYINRFSPAKGLEADLGNDSFPVHAISLTPARAYWAGASAIVSLRHDKLVPSTVAAVQSDFTTGVPAFILDAAHAYWAEPMNSVIKTVPIGGGTESVLTSASKPTSFFVDAASLYWTDAASQDVRVVPLGAPNAKSKVIAAGQEIVNGSRIVGDEEAVYWFTVGAITGGSGNDTGKVWRVTK